MTNDLTLTASKAMVMRVPFQNSTFWQEWDVVVSCWSDGEVTLLAEHRGPYGMSGFPMVDGETIEFDDQEFISEYLQDLMENYDPTPY